MTTINLPNGWRLWGKSGDYLLGRFTTKATTVKGKDVEIEALEGKATYHASVGGAVTRIQKELGHMLSEKDSGTLEQLLQVHHTQVEATRQLTEALQLGVRIMNGNKEVRGRFLVIGGGVR